MTREELEEAIAKKELELDSLRVQLDLASPVKVIKKGTLSKDLYILEGIGADNDIARTKEQIIKSLTFKKVLSVGDPVYMYDDGTWFTSSAFCMERSSFWARNHVDNIKDCNDE